MYLNLAHYVFFPVSGDLAQHRAALELALLEVQARGTVLLAPEGVNLNLAAHRDQPLEERLRQALLDLGCPPSEIAFKRSVSTDLPFARLKVRLKKEIVGLGRTDLDVPRYRAPHLSTQAFRQLLAEKRSDVLILDTRNDFEVEMGSFEGAVPAGTRRFREFTQVAQALPRDREIVMFCTGGVRCEKASALLREQGFDKVWQLEGGVLRYFEEQGRYGFKGELFVFDERVHFALGPDVGPDADG